MTVPLLLYLTLAAYKTALQENREFRLPCCPKCLHARVWLAGWYPRYVNLLVDGRWVREAILVRQNRCARCGASLSLLPAFCYPHRQYGPEAVEATVEKLAEKPELTAAELRGGTGPGPTLWSVRRWAKWIARLGGVIVQSRSAVREYALAASQTLSRLQAAWQEDKPAIGDRLGQYLRDKWADQEVLYLAKASPN